MKLPASEARARFAAARVARLATVSAEGVPHLVPVTFAVRGDTVVFAVDHKPKSTTALRRLDNIAANPRVAFLVDVYDDDWDRLWWVRADATAAIIDGADRLRAIAALRAKYQQYERVVPHGVVVGAAVQGWSGWRSTA